ncbi:MAG: PAS domain S-box protein [Chloroflexota bacterium]
MEEQLKDLKEEHAVQETLAVSEGRLRSVVELANDAIVTYDSKGIILSWNHAAEKLYGYTVDEVVGKSYSMVVVPWLREAFTRALARAVATGELVHGRKPFESAHCRKDGSEFLVEISTSPWRAGEAVYVTTITRDISERKRVEQVLKDSETRYRTIFETTGTATLLIEDDMTISMVNSEFERVSGYSRSEVEGKKQFIDFVPEEDRQRLAGYHRARREPQGTAPVQYEARFIARGGKILHGIVSVALIPGTRRSVVSVLDITEMKRAREEADFQTNLLANVNDAVIGWNSGMAINFWNRAAEQLYGWKAEEVQGRSARDLLDTRYLDRSREEAGEELRKKGYARGELLQRRKDGSDIVVESAAIAIRDAGGSVTGYAAVNRDITERKRMEKALLESGERYRRLVEDITDVIYMADPEGRITYVSPVVEKLIGYRPDEILGRRFASFVEQSNLTEVAEKVNRVGVGEAVEFEARIVTKDGVVKDVRCAARPEVVAGKVVGTFGTASDITGRREAERLFRSVAASSPVGIYIADKGKFIYVSEIFERQTGYSRSEILAMPTMDLVHPDDRAVVRESAVAMLKGKRFSPFEYRLVARSGEIRWMLESCTSIEYQGRRVTLGNAMNITEYKWLERQAIEYRELDKMKTGLLSSVSHELRTPLAAIKGYSTMLVDYDRALSKKEKAEYLISIDTAADRLTELVDHLLDMSRLESGMMKLDRIPINLQELVRAGVEEARLRSRGRRFVFKPGRRLPLVSADGRRVRQVLDNLIDNAVKYSDKRTVVTVRVVRSGNEAVVSVADRGIGISKEDLPRVFDSMFRAGQRLSTSVGGLGLGLNISKVLVEAHGGRIWLESGPGKGTTAYFTLPLIDNAGEMNVTKGR